jgi:hypothetical protein
MFLRNVSALLPYYVMSLRRSYYFHVVTGDYRRGVDRWIDLIGHLRDTQLKVITALLLISTLHKSLENAKSSQPSLDVSWRRLLTVTIFQLPALMSTHVTAARAELNSLNYRAISS